MTRRRRPVLVAAIVIFAIAAWGFWIEPRHLVVHEQAIRLPAWPAALEGLRVVAISDLHIGGPHMHLGRLAEIVARANELHPDVIALLGDYLADEVPTPDSDVMQSAPVLAALHAPLGVFAVLGNHDWWYGANEARAVLTSANIRVLDEEAVRIERGGARMWLLGIPDLTTGRPRPARILDAADIPDGEVVVALTHDPSVFPHVPARIALTLAGHTHGGQVRLPWIGAPIVPSPYGQRYVRGLLAEADHQLFVTTGIGTSLIPVRFGVPPQIAVLTLVR